MAEGKWISDLSGDTPLADAARRVLAVRLEVVRDYLPRAVHEPEKDVEYVHQLRVGTRRAAAALEIFALCLPYKVYKAARKQLRRIRQAAGEARDWDVFLETLAQREARLNGQAPEPHRPGLDFLLGLAFGQRGAAQAHLRAASPEPPFGFGRLLVETVAAVHEPAGDQEAKVLLDLARPLLSGLLRELDQAAARDLDDYEHLHQVRIIGKRLRYAMEIFADCFAPPFRERFYPAVEEMQEILGLANDSFVAGQRLGQLREGLQASRPAEWRRFKPGIDELFRFHQRRLPQQRRNFAKWWERWRKAGAEAAFAELLKSQSVAPS
jgi:CHAD domain-containing protein